MGARETVKQRSHLRNSAEESFIHNHRLPQTSYSEEKSKDLPWSKRINWQGYTWSWDPAIVFGISITITMILHFARSSGPPVTISTDVLVNRLALTTKNVRIVFPRPMDHRLAAELQFPDGPILQKGTGGEHHFGNLLFRTRAKFDDPIPIASNDYIYTEMQRQGFIDEMDVDNDDKYQPESSKEDQNPNCRKAAWAGYSFPSCNQLHEQLIERIGDDQYSVSYLNSGSFRDAYRFQRDNPSDHFVLKRIILADLQVSDIADIRKEALIMERLSSSPRVVDIYGFCGTSVLLEAMASDLHTKIIAGDGFASQNDLDELDDVNPLNNFTTSEKLQIALDMVESLADIHGFEGGMIVHADTHIERWLIAPDGRIKFNDFNNAREPMWDGGKQKYCEKRSRYGGVWRSPEEFRGGRQDESIDVYAYGNCIYTLLTGLWPYYDEEYRKIPHNTIRGFVTTGKKPFVDPRYTTRSLIEKGLVEIMKKCWAEDKKDRPTSFELVNDLRRLKEEAFNAGELKEVSLIKTPMPGQTS